MRLKCMAALIAILFFLPSCTINITTPASAPMLTPIPFPSIASTQNPTLTPEVSDLNSVPSASNERPETRTETISIEGSEEEISTQLYTSPDGFSLYYDAMRFAVTPDHKLTKIHHIGAEDLTTSILLIEHIADQSIEIISQRLFLETMEKYDQAEWINDKPDALEDGTIINVKFRAYNNPSSLGASCYFVEDRNGGTYALTIVDGLSHESIEGSGIRYYLTMLTFSVAPTHSEQN